MRVFSVLAGFRFHYPDNPKSLVSAIHPLRFDSAQESLHRERLGIAQLNRYAGRFQVGTIQFCFPDKTVVANGYPGLAHNNNLTTTSKVYFNKSEVLSSLHWALIAIVNSCLVFVGSVVRQRHCHCVYGPVLSNARCLPYCLVNARF